VELKDAVAIVTGSSSGVGAATARFLAARGAHVVINYNSRRDEAEAVAADCAELGAQTLIVQGEWLKQGMGSETYEARRESLTKAAPLKATCTPEDVAAAIASFITGSDLVTGESLIVDGGAHLAMAPLRR
jgi:3-oxoacyl-[acyl-carrier protein] reductase